MNKDAMYLDYAAATPLNNHVMTAMQPFWTTSFYNPSSPYEPAVEVRRTYEEAKNNIAHEIGGRGSEIIMTAGATESINIALGSCSGDIITTPIEHLSVLSVAKNITKLNKTNLKFSPVKKDGLVKLEELEELIDDSTELISIGLANNEIGTIQPIRKIAEMIKKIRLDRLKRGIKRPLLLHSDASQGLGLIDVNQARLGVDMLSINAAKVYGPKQVGALWFKPEVILAPLVFGGGQEKGIRSGTENVAGAVGFALALKMANRHQKFEAKRLREIRNKLDNTIKNNFEDVVFSGAQGKRLPNFSHFSFPGIDGERLVFRLEKKGVFVATGSACAANKNTGSHVLAAIGLPDELAAGSVRVSLGKFSTEENTAKAADIICQEVALEYERLNKI